MASNNNHNAHHTSEEAREAISRGEQFFEKYSKQILFAVLGILVVAIGVWAYINYVKKPRQEKATAALVVAEDKFIQGESESVLKTEGLEDHGVLAVNEKYAGTAAANLGHMYAGIAYYDMGKWQEALDELNKFSAKDEMLAPSIVRLMGDCCVQLDKLDEAIGYFEKAAKMADNPVVSPGALLKAARVYETQGKSDKALACYKQIKEQYYDSEEVRYAEANIARLEAAQ